MPRWDLTCTPLVVYLLGAHELNFFIIVDEKFSLFGGVGRIFSFHNLPTRVCNRCQHSILGPVNPLALLNLVSIQGYML